MTLNLTIVNPFGIWQGSDHRLTDPNTGVVVEDFSVKHVILRCRDGLALLASPHCVTSYVPPTGEPFESEFHDAKGANSALTIPMLLFGIDTTEMLRNVMTALHGQGAGSTASNPSLAAAGRNSVVSRNRLRP